MLIKDDLLLNSYVLMNCIKKVVFHNFLTSNFYFPSLHRNLKFVFIWADWLFKHMAD